MISPKHTDITPVKTIPSNDFILRILFAGRSAYVYKGIGNRIPLKYYYYVYSKPLYGKKPHYIIKPKNQFFMSKETAMNELLQNNSFITALNDIYNLCKSVKAAHEKSGEVPIEELDTIQQIICSAGIKCALDMSGIDKVDSYTFKNTSGLSFTIQPLSSGLRISKSDTDGVPVGIDASIEGANAITIY